MDKGHIGWRFRVASLSMNSIPAPIALAFSDMVTGTESIAYTDGTW